MTIVGIETMESLADARLPGGVGAVAGRAALDGICIAKGCRRRWRTSRVSSDDYRQPPKVLPAFAHSCAVRPSSIGRSAAVCPWRRHARFSPSELETWPLASHRALNLVSRGFFGRFVRVVPRAFGAARETCTNRPNRGGTVAALTIGPAATSFFRRTSTCRFRPSSAWAPSSWRSPASAKTTSSRSRTYPP